MRMTQEDVDAYLKKRKEKAPKLPAPTANALADAGNQGWRNKPTAVEAEYHKMLLRQGYTHVLREPMAFIMGRKCRYTPDFMTIHESGSIWFHEVKGPYTYEDAKVKYKVAASMFPFFGWVLAVKSKPGWTRLDLRTNQPLSIAATLDNYEMERIPQ